LNTIRRIKAHETDRGKIMAKKKDEILKSLDELRAEVRELKAFVKALYTIVIENGMGFEDEAPEDEFSDIKVRFHEDDFSM